MRVSRTAKIIVAVPVVLVGACAARSHIWWADAERAIARSATAIAAGEQPENVDLSVRAVTRSGQVWSPAADFREPYVTKGADTFVAGSSWRAVFDPAASAYVAHLVLPSGHEYHVEAIRQASGRWAVEIAPAEGR